MVEQLKIIRQLLQQKLQELSSEFTEALALKNKINLQISLAYSDILKVYRTAFAKTISDFGILSQALSQCTNTQDSGPSLTISKSFKNIMSKITSKVTKSPANCNQESAATIGISPARSKSKTIQRIGHTFNTESKHYGQSTEQGLFELEKKLAQIHSLSKQTKKYEENRLDSRLPLSKKQSHDSGSDETQISTSRHYKSKLYRAKDAEDLLQQAKFQNHLRREFIVRYAEFYLQQLEKKLQIYRTFKSNFEAYVSLQEERKSTQRDDEEILNDLLVTVNKLQNQTATNIKAAYASVPEIDKLKNYLELGGFIQNHLLKLVRKYRESTLIREWKVKVSENFIVEVFKHSKLTLTLEGTLIISQIKHEGKDQTVFEFDCNKVQLQYGEQSIVQSMNTQDNGYKVVIYSAKNTGSMTRRSSENISSQEGSSKKKQTGHHRNKLCTVLFGSQEHMEEFRLHVQKWGGNSCY